MENKTYINQNNKKVMVNVFLTLIMCGLSVYCLIRSAGNLKLSFALFYMLAGGCGLAFFGTALGYSLYRLIKKPVFLLVEEEGITDNTSLLSLGFIPWESVSNYYIKDKCLCVKLEDSYSTAQKQSWLKRFTIFANIKMGYEAVCISDQLTDYTKENILQVFEIYDKYNRNNI